MRGHVEECDRFDSIYKAEGYYFTSIGIIDWFGGCVSLEDMMSNIKRLNHYDSDGYEAELKRMKNISEVIAKEIGGETAHTQEFFAIPNRSDMTMDICAIAKQSNNGETFVVTKNKSFLDWLLNQY